MHPEISLLIRCVLLVALTLLPTACCQVEKPPADAVRGLVRTMRSTLPAGWKVKYTKGEAVLSIVRTTPAPMYVTMVSGPAFEQPETRNYLIEFTLEPFISPEEHRRLSEENTRMLAEIKVLHRALAAKRYFVKDGIADLKKEEDRLPVRRYKELTAILLSLPPYYFRNVSLRETYPPAHMTVTAKDKALREECDRVRQLVIGQFTKYKAP